MCASYVLVKVEEGTLRGQKITCNGISKVEYCAFQGIPFAKPPVGDLRFKAPVPAEPWEGIRDALEDGNCCPQKLFGAEVTGKEDCLYLNVYTPEVPAESEALKPVIFHIHGGGFTTGNGGTELFGPVYFMEHGVVFVSPNYRLGALGFLSLQSDNVSGNAGLKDQLQALLWTHKNIKQFGGDPENVTLMGLSAGGASVEYLLLSELSKGLFKRAIIQSGGTLNTWAFNGNPRKVAVNFAKSLGYTGSDQDDASIENFLKSCSAIDIVLNQENAISDQESLLLHRLSFPPCLEKPGKEQKFITRSPRQIFESGHFAKVPVIMGQADNEGFLYYAHAKNVNKELEELNNNKEPIIPPNLNVPEDKKTEVGTEIAQFYFNGKPISWDNIKLLTDLVGDETFGFGISLATQLFLQNSQPVYSYSFSFESSTGFMKNVCTMKYPGIQLKGVPHGGELEIMFRCQIPQMSLPEPTETDRKYITVLTSLLSSFAKTGNPNYKGMEFPEWEPSTKSKLKYLDIGNEIKMVSGRLYEERLQFWDTLYTKYGFSY